MPIEDIKVIIFIKFEEEEDEKILSRKKSVIKSINIRNYKVKI